MFSTSVAVVALCGFVSTSIPSQPVWHTDYRAAALLAVEMNKPLAVFITKGSGIVSRDLPTDVNRVLNADYVSLIVNSNDDHGKLLSHRFEMEQGVVISDRTGVKQALRIEGTINPGNFAETLSRLADPNRVPVRTEVQNPTATYAVPVSQVSQAAQSSYSEPVFSQPTPAYSPPTPVYNPPAYAAPSISRAVVPTYFAPASTAVCRTGT